MAICVVCSRCIKEASVAGVEAAKVKDEVRGLKGGEKKRGAQEKEKRTSARWSPQGQGPSHEIQAPMGQVYYSSVVAFDCAWM